MPQLLPVKGTCLGFYLRLRWPGILICVQEQYDRLQYELTRVLAHGRNLQPAEICPQSWSEQPTTIVSSRSSAGVFSPTPAFVHLESHQ